MYRVSPRLLAQVICVLNDSGTLADVTFMRINAGTSGPVDDFYGERDEVNKNYTPFPVRGQVEENPRHNIYGPGGGEKVGDLRVTFYGEQGYTPHNADHILWRGERFEVITHERIHPSGVDYQMGWIVVGRRFS